MASAKDMWHTNTIYLVDISIIRGNDMLAKDHGNTSDPYVNVHCTDGNLKRKYKTQIIYKTLDPTWNERTQFQFLKKPEAISFKVFDKDKVGKDAMGECELNIARFFEEGHAGLHNKALAVTLKSKPAGTLTVSVQCRQVNPVVMSKELSSGYGMGSAEQKHGDGDDDALEKATEKLRRARDESQTLDRELTSLEEAGTSS